jgi:hypothetical protein
MKKMPTLSLVAAFAVASTSVFAGTPAPGPEIGEGSIGLLAVGISAVVYVVYKFKNKK